MPFPRVNSRTPLQTPARTSPPWSPKIMSINPLSAYLVAALHPRKHKHRTTFIALLVLVCLTAYIFVAYTSYISPPIALRHSGSSDQLAIALEILQNSRVTPGASGNASKHRLGKSHRIHSPPPLRLDPPQELAAITSFLASLPQNVIPLTVDPTRPIDPQLVLDFDTRGHRAQEELQQMVDDVWTRNPVFLYSKVYSPASRELKGILENLNLKPAPTTIDVDVRDDAAILLPMLSRLLPFPQLPVLLIGGKAVGSIEEVRELEKNGELQKLITASGSVIDGAKRKKHRK